MKSPFPGVDPYLEQHWGDIHTRLMVYLSDQIDQQLPAGLQARVEESVSVDIDESSRWIYPDVRVIEDLHSSTAPVSALAVAGTIVVEPTIIPLANEQVTERHIEIVDLSSGHRVVTAIELLSPSNKREALGRSAYRRKQREYLAAGVNLVEIDLIRSGDFIVAAPEERVPTNKRTLYIICIRRVQRPAEAEIIPVPITSAVPNFRIPLRPVDVDVVVQLQPLLDECYRRGRYQTIDYSLAPVPKLDASTAAWAEQLLRSQSR